MNSTVTHLECSLCNKRFEAGKIHNLCECGGPLLVRYDLAEARRAWSREELWGTGNRETFANAFFSRQSILLYALNTHRRNRERFAIECAFLGKDKTIVRLRSTREVEAFLASHSAPAG